MSVVVDQPQPPDQAEERTPPGEPRRRGAGWFRAFWRWHFYASFVVIPFLLMLSVTGLIYLFRFQIEPLLHRDLMTVDAPADASAVAQPYAAQADAVSARYPDATVVSMTEPRGADEPTVFSVETAEGGRDVYVSPWTNEVLGSLDPDSTLSGIAVRLHGDLMVGRLGDYAIELAACWAIVMAITGYVLLVQGRTARLRRTAARGKGAALRSRHALVGAVAGAGLLFLLVSGLPWTGFWGEKAQTLATEQGTSMWSLDPGALSDPTSTLDESLPHSHEVPWALGDTPVPASDESQAGTSVATIDTATYVAGRAGLRHPMTVAMPADEGGVYSVIGYAFDAPSDEKTVHVDRYGGQVVATYGFDDYPALAKVVSQGIGLHEGRTFGGITMVTTTAFCLAIIFLCVTGPLMWWRRRPRGASSIGAPRGRLPLRTSPLLVVVLIALGLFLPLFGLSLVVVLLIDQLVLRRVPTLSRWFDVVDGRKS